MRRALLLFITGSLLALAGYWIFSLSIFRSGFPLDDAWIHQTYARNLIDFGQWSYIPGEASAGSTAPLWTILLSVGYILQLEPLVWVFILGWFTLAAIGWFVYRYVSWEFPENTKYAWLASAIILLEFHLVWAALSGMETLLFGLFILIIIPGRYLFKFSEIIIGTLIGLSVWIRPDGILLLLPAAIMIIADDLHVGKSIKSIFRMIISFALLFAPYLLFNYLTAGSIWPSTFYAKQAEYSILRDTPLLIRILNLYSLPLIGVGAILLPAFIYYGFRAVYSRNWSIIAGYLWIIGFIGLYVLRLPVTYQHGRYIIPIMPIYLLFGLCGMPGLLKVFHGKVRYILTRGWIVSAILVVVIFWWFGGQAYGKDVAIIESELVDTAKWIANETAPEARIAAHDIGALGYFSGRQILDLAGLISPQVIPIIRNEAKLISFINEYQADYLVTFPDWYTTLPACGDIVYRSRGEYVELFVQENMTVYRWKASCSLP